ncbi:LysR substrate-binding domain-containing protein [Oceanimonas sp. NS1]|nr:LysR substrate-binding domain-containing protein [Oceanimonas sp. NS1]
MNIETKWLEDFLSLAHTQSFSRSAQERHMTQPAFSRRIRALETALGCELVDRTSTPVQLTDEGRLFRITARNLVTQLADSIGHLRSMKQRGAHTIDFAVSHTLSLSLFPAFLQSFRRELEGISTRQLVANVDDSVQALKTAFATFCWRLKIPPWHRGSFTVLSCKPSNWCRCVAPMRTASPFSTWTPPMVPPLPYLGYPEEIFLGRCVERLLRSRPRTVTLRQAFESPLADSLKVMAMQGMGIAWVPSFAIREELRQGFLVICGDDRWQLPLNVCLYRCNRPLSDTAEAFWQVCEQNYGRAEPTA